MFDISVLFHEDDFGGSAGTTVTVYESLADTPVLLDFYAHLTDEQVVCETCDRVVLRVETGVMGSRVITEFLAFGCDEEDSGTILCATCILKGAALGQSVVEGTVGAEGRGRHRLATV